MVVPVGKDLRVAATFLHEYGHHLDRAWSVSGVPERTGRLCGGSSRHGERSVAQGSVAFDYARGWNRSVGEIFAEDYAWIHIPYQHAIPWLRRPTRRFALRCSRSSAANRRRSCPRSPRRPAA